MTDTAIEKKPSDAVCIAKFFDLKGKDAREEIVNLSSEDKIQLGEGIRNGTLTY